MEKMIFFECFILLALVVSGQCFPKPYDENVSYAYDFPYMSRSDWGARPPVNTVSLSLPVRYVIIHHSYIPGPCSTTNQCINAMRSMQNSHQLHQGWDDIGYNFAVGGDGVVYEGRGWYNVGAHAIGYNFDSIGIVLIGDFVSRLPPEIQLNAAKRLIEKGVELGHISRDYYLLGHRQVTATECPGNALFREITTWDRFANYNM
ncbi:peptidoglycan-recognition protein LB isoform X1 [Papilio machaon]|uniref:peptidoglycan-recognition protein LB isoform X1 n=2 Tax=Papilio machaon TaxID=76193 RepID=UPI001E665700|nr:peptidoglycan-recognition protein LB isoform X1 [Papilio machaon]